jgi:hypothetical protein
MSPEGNTGNICSRIITLASVGEVFQPELHLAKNSMKDVSHLRSWLLNAFSKAFFALHNAALGCAQMESLPQYLQLKRELAKAYKAFFADSEYTFFTEPEGCRSNYWLNVILAKDTAHRDELLAYTNDNGVMTRPIWRLMNELDMFRHCRCGNLENSKWFEERVVNIPSSAIIKDYRK